MLYSALATDYDGTIATEGQVEPATLAALECWRATGRRLILITGRMLDDLLTILPQYAPLALFDWIVAENGAVLYHPVRAEVQLLTTPPPDEFVQQLRARIGNGSKMLGEAPSGEFAHLVEAGQLNAFSMGRIIVATWQPYEREAEELIKAMNVPLQIIMNKRAVMILPQGIDKAFGLKAAVQALNLSPDQVVGVGDAENDCHFLELCGFSAAVANALPTVKAQASWVASQARGAGVIELIEYLLRNDDEKEGERR